MCKACLGACGAAYHYCGPCQDTWHRAAGQVADLIVPITYRRGHEGQHSQNLRMYKQEQGNRAAARSLTALFAHFCLHHIACVKRAAAIEHFSHVAFVPSTKVTEEAIHPLESMLAPKVRSLAPVQLSVNPEVASTRRRFEPGWFHVETDLREYAADILLIDDTWVTGSRAQSAAHMLKLAGARKVVVLLLARQVSPSYSQAKTLLKRMDHEEFDMDVCAFHDERGPAVLLSR